MKIELWMIGKTTENYLQTGIEQYQKRLQHYCKFTIESIPNLKNRQKLTTDQIKTKEGAVILSKVQTSDFLILLDERGKVYTSVKFSGYLEQLMSRGYKRVIFLIGGAYGFSDAVYQRANSQLSLSAMTFSHQMVRLFFAEQLYRAFTILNNEPYHHE